MALFIIQRGKTSGDRIPLEEFPITAGRDITNDVVLPDQECSRIHIRVKKRGYTFILEDLNSKNGTYVNGDRVINSVIKNGDRILIGSTEMVFMTAVANIQFAQEVGDFNMIISEQEGLAGPIDISKSIETIDNFQPTRLPLFDVSSHSHPTIEQSRKLFDIHSNVLLQENLENASSILLKHVGRMFKGLSGAAFFLWHEPQKQLIPISARHEIKDHSFILSHRAFSDVINRKQTVILNEKNTNVTKTGRERALIPMISGKQVVAVLHLESAVADNPFPVPQLEFLQGLLLRVASYFDSMILRKEVDYWLIGMMETIIATVEAKDTYTRGHSERVSTYSMAIADALKLDRETKKLLMVSALCHDVGKIGIPDSILKKAGILSTDEYNEMKLHPTIGADIMSHMPNAQRFLSGVKYHHEKWDGTGYPEGLMGEEIPFFARIVAVSDVYDAMISGRSYSGFLDQTDAAEQLVAEQDLFDPEIQKAFGNAFNSGSLSQKTDTQNQEADEAPKEKLKKI